MSHKKGILSCNKENHRNKEMTALVINASIQAEDLIIDFSELLKYPSQLLIKSWHKGVSWKLNVNGLDETFEYLEDAPIPLEFIETRETYHYWYKEVPQLIRHLVKGYKNIEFSVLYLTSRHCSAHELFVSQPTLFFLLITQARNEKWTELELIELLKNKRTALLEACQLPAKRSAVKLIQQLDFKQYGKTEYETIKQLLSYSNYEKINHLKAIDEHLASLLCRYPELIATRLITNYQSNQWQQNIYTLLDDITRMAAQLGIMNIIERVGQCTGFEQVETMHNRLVDEINQLDPHSLPDVNYQSPPFSGNEHIIPISNSQDLLKEGKEQRHCITSYHPRIFNKKYYAYRVIYPQRATLGLVLKKGFKPQLDQLKLKSNQRVSEETSRYVLQWLAKSIEDYEL